MADLTSQQLDRAEGWKFAAKPRIFGAHAFRKYQPNAIVPGRLGAIPEHADDAVAQVDGES
jgi:hypothetical protein